MNMSEVYELVKLEIQKAKIKIWKESINTANLYLQIQTNHSPAFDHQFHIGFNLSNDAGYVCIRIEEMHPMEVTLSSVKYRHREIWKIMVDLQTGEYIEF